MGSVQKLATVVMIGLVALATVILVYTANEPNRRDTAVTGQDDLAIERGTELYITYCLQCHGPTGKGAAEGDGRIGGILNQEGMPKDGSLPITYQSDNPSLQSKAEQFAHYRIVNGAPGDPRLPLVMPAFGNDLNVEQINDLVYMIMHVDWNYVYNQSVLATGESKRENDCLATPDLAICSAKGTAPAAWPTVPPTAVPTTEGSSETGAVNATPEPSAQPATNDAGTAGSTGSSAPIELDAQDISWSQKEITVKPGDTITVKNVGALPHDFSVDELGISDPVESGQSVTVTIPADAKPGEYQFYCNVPGHKEAGMVGTLTVQP